LFVLPFMHSITYVPNLFVSLKQNSTAVVNTLYSVIYV